MTRRPHRRIQGLVALALLSSCNGNRIDFAGATGGAPSTGTTGGAAGATGGFVAIVEITGEDSGGAPANPTGTCPELGMPSDPTLPGYTAPRSPEVATALSDLTSADPEGKYKQMYGIPNPPDRGASAYGNLQQTQDVTLSNGKTLRGLKYRDAGRGVNLDAGQPNNRPRGQDGVYESYSTAFPVESIRAASWDVDMEMQVGEAIGDEVMASLNNLLFAPSMNILRHPYWGRSQDTYGEDTYHVGRMASAFVAGVQQHVMACAKHFAANNIEVDRSEQNAVMSEQTLREMYASHFGMVITQGGVGCVMAAYNLVNGTKCTQNQHLLKQILKAPIEQNGFGFRGFVVSDLWAMPGGDSPVETSSAQQETIEAIEAGLDIEVPWSLHFAQLPTLVNNGMLTEDQIDDSVSRVLEQKLRFGIAYPTDGSDPKSGPWGMGTATTTLGGPYGDSLTNTQKHLELAEEVEIRSAVLLKNGTTDAPVLPINSRAASVAVIGLDRDIGVATSTNLQPGGSNTLHFATDINTGDRGSSRVNSDPATSIGPYEGIAAAAANHGITNITSGNSVDAAKGADLVVVIVGLHAGDEGEEYAVKTGGDRSTLDLPGDQNAFVDAALTLDKPTVIIIESGSIVNVPWLSHSNQKQATVWAGYSGQHGGVAYGKLLFGDRNFSGKLPVSWPQESDLNALIPFLNPADPNSKDVNMGYFFGYRMYDRHSEARLVFPFGYGLSYTTFRYSNLRIPCASAKKTDVVYVSADIENTGTVAGDEIMMLFVSGPQNPTGISGERPMKELKRFQRVNGIQPAGQPKSRFRVTFPIAIQDLRHWEGEGDGHWVIDSGDYTIYVGPNSGDLKVQGKLTVQDQ